MIVVCDICEQAPAVWHTVTIIAGGLEIHANPCEECADDLAEGDLVNTMVLLWTPGSHRIPHITDFPGIDLDPRNAHLARQRVGMFMDIDA